MTERPRSRLATVGMLAAMMGGIGIMELPRPATPMVPDGGRRHKPASRIPNTEPPKLAKMTRQARRRLAAGEKDGTEPAHD